MVLSEVPVHKLIAVFVAMLSSPAFACANVMLEEEKDDTLLGASVAGLAIAIVAGLVVRNRRNR